VVNCSYVTARGHALFDFRLYLPKAWCPVPGRRQRAQVPRDVAFQTKTELARDMIGGHPAAGVPFAWVAGDEVYGRASKLRGACQQAGKGYVLAVLSSFQARLPSGRKIPVAALARLIPAAAWETRSCGPGCKGHRDYGWAWAGTWSPWHWACSAAAAPTLVTSPSSTAMPRPDARCPCPH
jgi:SRSO17 transposase